MSFFKKNFKNKKIIITGHTGFKGSWLSIWLNHLEADVMGISDKIITKPSFYKVCDIENKIKSEFIDIRELTKLKQKINSFKPDFIFHLAAQALVKKSYQNPLRTWQTNILGTINLLEVLRFYKKNCSVVIVTSDKAYKNLEIKRGYRENDILAGSDPYSASKSCADIVVQSYIKSYFNKNNKVSIAIARAGNVIGGGDWSSGRFMVDCIKAWKHKKPVLIRNPKATRPWQHVLEALSGYLHLAIKLKNKKKIHGEAFNFGPDKKNNFRVIDILKKINKYWKGASWKIKKNNQFYETTLLKLNSNKAKKYLSWNNVLTINETLSMIADWYITFYKIDKKKLKSILKLSLEQIRNYENKIKEKK